MSSVRGVARERDDVESHKSIGSVEPDTVVNDLSFSAEGFGLGCGGPNVVVVVGVVVVVVVVVVYVGANAESLLQHATTCDMRHATSDRKSGCGRWMPDGRYAHGTQTPAADVCKIGFSG